MSRDFYEILGIGRHATDDEIKRAYRTLARRYHPDANGGDPEAEVRFKEISVAYETLRDPERRRRYDTFGERDVGSGAGDAFGFSDLFEAFFSGGDPFGGGRGPAGPVAGADVEIAIELSLAEAAFGTTPNVELTLPVECDRCDGSGCEPGTHPSRCDVCGGAGQVRQVRRSILGQLVTAVPCAGCEGTGRRILSPCSRCRGDGRIRAVRSVELEVPPGVDDGQRLRVAGRGAAAPRGGPPGDLFVTVRVRPHPEFERSGDDLVHVRRLSVSQAILGVALTIETLEGTETLTVPPGTQPGDELRLKGHGVPSLRRRGRGDLRIRIEVVVPEKLSGEEEELVRKLAALRGDDVSEPGKGTFSRLRSAFK